MNRQGALGRIIWEPFSSTLVNPTSIISAHHQAHQNFDLVVIYRGGS